MFTRCPSCQATFRVTAAILQMADGEVRCGACGSVFNALHTLVDDWTGTDFLATGAPQLGHPHAPPAPPAGPASEPTLEFDVPENEWQQYFIAEAPVAAARIEPALGADFDPGDPVRQPDVARPAEAAGDDAPAPSASLEEETADTATWQAFLREGETDDDADAADEADDIDDAPAFVLGDEDVAPTHLPAAVRPPEASVDALPGDIATDATTLMTAEMPPDDGADPTADAAPHDLGETMAAEDPAGPAEPPTVLDWGPAPVFGARAPQRPARTGPWLAASLVAALALAGQAVHHFRDELAAHPAWGAAVRMAYARLGLTLHPAWPLDAYEVRSVKAIAENSAPGALDIVAEVAVSGEQPVGPPMIRVVLRDRWSNTVASGAFEAAGYLAEPAPESGVYAPGSMIPLHITLEDPGSAAQGYELDVCIPSRTAGLQCRSARDPFRR